MKIIIDNDELELNNIVSIKGFNNNNCTYARIEIDVELKEGTPYFDISKEKVIECILKFLRKDLKGRHFNL